MSEGGIAVTASAGGPLQVMIASALQTCVNTDSRNCLLELGLRIYDAPLISVAWAGDPVFEEFRQEGVVGPHHRLPTQWLPGARSVVSYFLPFSAPIRESNRLPGLPSEEWVHARIEGEAFNNVVRARLVEVIASLGGRAVAPALEPEYGVVDLKSNWSERHVAYAAGLGSFGLGRSFITPRGCAGRLGSVVTDLELVTTPRITGPYGHCPHLSGGSCGECIARCPVGAITSDGKDLGRCQSYMDVMRKKFAPRYGCAKCQVGVACEESIPG